MKTSQLTMQGLLALRLRQEQTALQQYGDAINARQAAFEKLEAIKRHCDQSWALHRDEVRRGASEAQVSQVESYCLSIEANKKQCETEILEAQREVDQRWQRLVNARKQRELLDRDHAGFLGTNCYVRAGA